MRFIVGVLLFSLASILQSAATELRIVDHDARAAARANAFVATADNASAVYYNPAALSQLSGHNVRLGFLARFNGLEHTAPDGRKTSLTSDFDALPQLFYSYSSTNVPLSMGLGVYSPFYTDIEWPNSAQITVFNRIYRQQVGTIHPVLALPLGDRLSLGGGPTFNLGHFQNRIHSLDNDDVFTENKGDGGGIGFTLGLLWKPHVKHSFGLTYHSGVDMHFEGKTRIKNSRPPVPSAYYDTFEFTLPPSITAGYSFRPTTNWNLEFNLEWADWEDYWDIFRAQNASRYSYAFGVTRIFGTFSVSAGYKFYEDYGDGFQTVPLSPESDHHIFSIGLGKRFGKWEADIAYQFDYGIPVRIENSMTIGLMTDAGPVYQTMDGRYNPWTQVIMLSLGRTF